MPEHLKVLALVLAVGTVVFWTGERIFCPRMVAVEDFRRRRNAWFGVVLITFLSHNFWLSALLTACLTFLLAKRDHNPLAVYMTVFLAVPWYSMEVPGFGLVNYFVTMNHFKVINLAILLPLVLSRSRLVQPGRLVRWTDWAVVAYLSYTAFMLLPARTATSAMRDLVDTLVTVGLPYMAFSRMESSRNALREIFVGLLVGASILGLIAPYESMKSWLIFESLRQPLGVPPPDLLTYIFRGEDGLLRANGTVGNSIVLGYVMMIGVILALLIRLELTGVIPRLVILVPLGAGLVFSLSRGPWVACAVGIVTFLLLSRGSVRTVGYLGSASLLAYLAIQFVPSLKAVLDFLPFVGEVDGENITYRQRLFEVGMVVFLQHPVFGAIDYITNPVMEEMRQGQGIIDMVNTYLGVGLAYGAVGLMLFLLPFLIGLFSAAQGLSASPVPEVRQTNAALLAVLIAVMITIATVSSISVVAPLYWIFIAIAANVGSCGPLTRLRTQAAVAGPSPRVGLSSGTARR